jgi:hypothetical protein
MDTRWRKLPQQNACATFGPRLQNLTDARDDKPLTFGGIALELDEVVISEIGSWIAGHMACIDTNTGVAPALGRRDYIKRTHCFIEIKNGFHIGICSLALGTKPCRASEW